MSPNVKPYYDYPWGFPRVSGDEPGIPYAAGEFARFSPRERG